MVMVAMIVIIDNDGYNDDGNDLDNGNRTYVFRLGTP